MASDDPFALDARVSIPGDPDPPGAAPTTITTTTVPISIRICTRYPVCTTLGCTLTCTGCTLSIFICQR